MNHPPRFRDYLSRAAALVLVILTLLAVLILYYTFRSKPPDYDLSKLPTDQPYQTTHFEFRYGPKTRIITDPHNQLRFGYGAKPDSISVKNGQRLIIFNSHGVVLHTSDDSIDVRNSNVRYKGHMGISTNGSKFEVHSDGYIIEEGVTRPN